MSRGITYLAIISMAVLFFNCQPESENGGEKECSDKIWKDLPAHVLTMDQMKSEIADKEKLLQKFMSEKNLSGMLFTQVRNVNWITAGYVNTQIVLNKDVGAASLLIMSDGSKYVIGSGSEIPRMMDEDLKELGYTAKQYNWYEANPVKDVRGSIIREIAGNGRVGSDIPFPGTILTADEFEPLRYSLLETEIERYRWLGKETTEAIDEVCRNLRPGMDEFQIEAMTAAALNSRGILPTVLLIAVDERISKYRHGLPFGAELKNYAMVNVVAEKWGMPMAVTRFVYFGTIPEDLQTKLEKTAVVNAKYQQMTKSGTKLADIFEACKSWYAEAGYEGEWKLHHQGGAIGYDDREYVIYPGIEGEVQPNQGFAWNPTITGTKIEETIIAYPDSFEVVTVSEGWPMIDVEMNGHVYPQPAILQLDPETYEVIPQDSLTVKVQAE